MNKDSLFVLAIGAALAAPALPAFAQSFQTGDLYIISASLPRTPNSGEAGIERVQPGSWTTTRLYTGPEAAFGRGAYDPWRDRILLLAGSAGFRTVAADGSTGLLAIGGPPPSFPSPAGDGRVFFYRSGGTLGVVNGAGMVTEVLNEAGTAPASISGGTVQAMTFDTTTATVVVGKGGLAGGAVSFERLNLRADGLQVVGRASVTVSSPGSGMAVSGFSAGPSGTLFAAIYDNGDGCMTKLLDVATMTVTTFATENYQGSHSEVAGAYDPAVNGALLLDSFNDTLHLFTMGQNGAGTVVVSSNVSSAGGSGETAQILVIGPHGPVCGTADFNGDGDVGTDQDIEAFFACLAGTCCATCGTADFNGDGDVGTDQDIEAFFRVLAGGSC